MTPPTDLSGINVSGTTVVLTGATSGLGYEAAIKYLNAGVDNLIIGCRSLERGKSIKEDLEKRTSRHGVIHIWELEMNSFASVKAFASRIANEIDRLDIALLNAGLWNRKYTLSPEGWEETLQVNALSTSLLALLLLPKLRNGGSSEFGPAHLSIVSSQQFTRVKSGSIRTDGPLLEHLNDPNNFNGPKQYGISKLLVEYTVKNVSALTRNDNGTLQVIVNSVSPGFCMSSLGRQYNKFYERWLLWLVYKIFARTTEQGSRSLVSATFQGPESHGKCCKGDGYVDESAALTTDPEGRQLQTKSWREMIDVFAEQLTEVRNIVEA